MLHNLCPSEGTVICWGRQRLLNQALQSDHSSGLLRETASPFCYKLSIEMAVRWRLRSLQPPSRDPSGDEPSLSLLSSQFASVVLVQRAFTCTTRCFTPEALLAPYLSFLPPSLFMYSGNCHITFLVWACRRALFVWVIITPYFIPSLSLPSVLPVSFSALKDSIF